MNDVGHSCTKSLNPFSFLYIHSHFDTPTPTLYELLCTWHYPALVGGTHELCSCGDD